EVKDLLAYLRLIVNPDDDAAFLRIANVPRRDIGTTTLEKLGRLAQARHCSLLQTARNDAALAQIASRQASALVAFGELIGQLASAAHEMAAAELIEELIRRTHYEAHLREQTGDPAAQQRRRENLDELVGWFRAMQRNGSGAQDLANQLALLTHGDRDDGGDAVRLMTLHSAKGLEFRFVYLAGVEEGTLPHAAVIDQGPVDEERRLFYVGITRAKERLCLSYAARSRRYGEIVSNEPSRFLAELPQDDLHWDGRDAGQDDASRRELASSHIARLADLLAD
ncbi:MAG TPA: 3'-5' exonuclease, partial [Rudaea sp.]|nr:3'-5' exonuclease [Rudaea sp.]